MYVVLLGEHKRRGYYLDPESLAVYGQGAPACSIYVCDGFYKHFGIED